AGSAEPGPETSTPLPPERSPAGQRPRQARPASQVEGLPAQQMGSVELAKNRYLAARHILPAALSGFPNHASGGACSSQPSPSARLADASLSAEPSPSPIWNASQPRNSALFSNRARRTIQQRGAAGQNSYQGRSLRISRNCS